MKLKLGSLFSGIGGIELGIESTNQFETVWQVDNNQFTYGIRKKFWPNVPNFNDVKSFCLESKIEDRLQVDAICGGFPCKQVSNLAVTTDNATGLAGQDSGLWFEYLRIIKALSPKYIFIENVGALATRGLHDILKGLHEAGYNAEWATLSASMFGLPHLRKRTCIIGHKDPNLNIFINQPEFPSNIINPEVKLIPKGETFPDRRERLQSLGNAMCPQLAEFLGNCMFKIPQDSSGIKFGIKKIDKMPPRGLMIGNRLGMEVYGLPTLDYRLELVKYRTPVARDWKGMTSEKWRTREKGDKTPSLPDQLGGNPHPEFIEELMGFNRGWTEL